MFWSLINGGFNDGPAAVFLLLLIYLAGGLILHTIINFAKERQQREVLPPVADITQARVHPSVSDVTRVGDGAVQQINETRDAYLETVETITRR